MAKPAMKPKPWTGLRILKKVRRVLGNPCYWGRVSSAVDARGRRCDVRDPKARRWCLVGGVYRAGPVTTVGFARDEALESLCICLPDRPMYSLGEFNDTHEHHEVMALLDRAIERLETKP